MTRSLPSLAVGALLLTVVASVAQAQVPSTPRALGAAGAWVAAAKGQETLFLNPANLGLGNQPEWSFGIAGFSTAGTISGLEIADIPDLVEFNDLSDEDRDELFARVPDAGITGGLDVRAPIFALQIGNVAAGVAYTSTGTHGISRDIVELFLFGFEEGRTDYDISTTQGSRATFLDFAVGYGQRVGNLSLGVTGHYLKGQTLLESWARQPRIDIIERDIEVGYTAVYAEGGNGYALDLGAAFQPTGSLTLSAAVTNAYSRLDWSDDLRLRELVLTSADFDTDDPTELVDRYTESDRAVTEADAGILRGLTPAILQDEAQLPTVLRLGAGWQPFGGTLVSGSWSEAVTAGRLEGKWDRSAGVGFQQQLLFITGRVGFATNLDGGHLMSAGASLGGVDFGIARLSEEEGARDGYIVSFGISGSR
jgi:hypothetical protein